MPILHVVHSNESSIVNCSVGQILGEAMAAYGLPLEQPCAGRGTCGKCKVLAEGGLAERDAIEESFLLAAERVANIRLACRARIVGDVRVTLTPAVVYSNKIFTRSDEFRTNDDPLGLVIDLGSTTVAALLVSLKSGLAYAGAAALNQQTLFGADVISRLGAARTEMPKLSALAQASIYQAMAALRISRRVRARIQRVVIVGNSAMHHLLLQYPVQTLAVLPFQPHNRAAIRDGARFFGNLFPEGAQVMLPPLVGGFVGSDTTACLAYFGFGRTREPMLAIDLGTNGEVMVTDGDVILVASTAAGPAFEGVNISSGTRAVDGAIVGAHLERGRLRLATIGHRSPVGITGSGLLALAHALKSAGALAVNGRLAQSHATIPIERREGEIARVPLNERVALTQGDIRELQKAKAAIRVAIDLLLEQLHLSPRDLGRTILTGSFGSQLDVDAMLGLGVIPQVDHARLELAPNGAGLGAAMFLQDKEFAFGEELAAQTRHVELDLAPEFNARFVQALSLE